MKTTTYQRFGYAVMCSALLLAAACEREHAVAPAMPMPAPTAPDAYARYAAGPLRPNGTYEVEQLRDDTFQSLGRTAQDEFLREAEHALDASTWRGPEAEITVRVRQVTGYAAHLDAVTLGDATLLRASADGMQGAEAAALVRKLAARDLDLTELPREPLTLVFARPTAPAPLRVTARIEAERICDTPFHFPKDNGPAPLAPDSKYFSYRVGSSPGALVLDGALDEVSDARPFMREFAKAGTGHPSDDVLAWVRDDGQRLYVAIDFTGDNTLDGGKDYAAVYVNTTQGVREYKVTAEDTRHGVAGFGYSKAVSYAHKLYEISISLAELGGASLETLQLAFGAYGTCSPCLCEHGTNFDVFRRCCPPDEMDIRGICCDTELAADGTCLPPRGPVFDISLLEHSGFNEHITDVSAVFAVGHSNFPGDTYATAWRPNSSSRRFALMTTDDFANSVTSYAFGINDSGSVVGWRSYDDGESTYARAFILTPPGDSTSPYSQDSDPTHYITQNLQSYPPNLNEMEHLPVSEAGDSFAVAINNADPPQSVGGARSGPYMAPARWDGTLLTILPGLDANDRGLALAINDDGVAAGYAVDVVQVPCGEEICDVDVEHPVIWDGNALLDLGVQCPTCSARAVDINNLGWVAGYTYVAGSADPYAFVYIPFTPPAGMQSGMNIIGIGPTMIGGNSYFGSAAYFQTIGINDVGQIVGTVMEAGSPRAFIRLPEPAFDIEAGTYFLDDLIPQVSGGPNDGLSTHIVQWPVDITNDGTIIARSFRRNSSAGDNEYYLGLQRSEYRPYDSLPYIDDIFVPVVIDTDFSAEDGDPVNTFSGELIVREEPDIAVGALKLERFYASRLEERAEGPTPLGPGWRHQYQWSLTRDEAVDPPIVTVISPEGSRVELQHEEGAWIARAADGTGYQLAEVDDGYEVVTPVPQRLMRFDEEGRLTGVESPDGYAQTLSYTDGLLTSVSDSFGNALTLSYDGEQLESVSDGARTVGFAYDAPGEPLRFVTDLLGHVTEYTYDGAQRMLAKILPKGEAHLTQAYDDQGRVISQTDPFENVTHLEYDYDDIPYRTARIDSDGFVRVHQYTPWGRLLTTHDESGYETQFHYDEEYGGERYGTGLGLHPELEYRNDPTSGRPASSVDVAGGTTEHSYEAGAWSDLTRYDRVHTAYADGTSDNATYDRQPGGTTVTLTDRGGASSTLIMNAVGQVVSSESPIGGVTTYSYYADGSLQSATSPVGDTTELVHALDGTNLITTLTYPDGAQRVLTYDAQRKLVARREVPAEPLSAPREHSYTYDDNGNLESATDPLGGVALYAFDAMDRLTELVDPAGYTHAIEYEDRGLVERVVDGSGVEMLFEHDGKGQLSAMIDAHGLRWEIGYDFRGRVISRTAPETEAVAYEYDEGARQLRITDPLGATTTLSYDEMGRVLAVDDSEGGLTCYGYDDAGRITSATLPSLGLTTPCHDRGELDLELAVIAQYEWNEAGLLRAVIDPNGERWERSYDDAGRLDTTFDPHGRATTYVHDARDRLSSVTHPNGDHEALHYDDYGYIAQRVYSAEGAEDEVFDFTYDALGRIESVNDETFAYGANGVLSAANGFAFTSDGAGRLLTVAIDDDKVVTYVYDEGRLSAVQDWLGGEVTFGYDDRGRLHQVARTNGITTTYGYDELDRVTSIAEATQEPVAEISVEYAPGGRVGQITRTGHAQAIAALATPDPRSFDAASQIEDDGFDYDARGRPTLGDGRSYTWSASNRLVSIAEDAQTVSFAYDAYGSLVERTHGASTTTYRHSYAHTLPCPMERNAGGEITYYVCTPDGELLYGIAAGDGARHYFHFDEGGNTRLVSDGEAHVIASYAYLPFGARAGGSVTPGFDNPFTFGGRFGVLEEGESGLFHMRKRVYDSRTQRFLTRDPLGQQLEPRLANPYQYAANDPIMFVDPIGTIPTPVAYDGTTADKVVDTVLKVNTEATYALKEGATALADALADEARLVRKYAPPSALKTQTLTELWGKVGKLDKVADIADKAGTAGDVLGSALEGYKTAEKLNGIHAETLSCQDTALRTLGNQLDAIRRSVKDGRISPTRGAELGREFSSQFDAALAQCESRSWIDTGITALEGFKNTLAGITPAPVQHGLSAFESGVQKLGNSRNPFVFVKR